jgi:hypothetical protein
MTNTWSISRPGMSEDLDSFGAWFAVTVLGEALLESQDCAVSGQRAKMEDGMRGDEGRSGGSNQW